MKNNFNVAKTLSAVTEERMTVIKHLGELIDKRDQYERLKNKLIKEKASNIKIAEATYHIEELDNKYNYLFEWAQHYYTIIQALRLLLVLKKDVKYAHVDKFLSCHIDNINKHLMGWLYDCK